MRIDRAVSLLKVIRGGCTGDKLVEDLILFGYPIPKYTGDNIESIAKAFEGYLKLEIMELKEASREVNKDSSKPKETTRENFYDMLTAINETLGISLNESEVSVSRYCSAVRRYISKIEFEIKNNKGNESI